jgi:WD40 repeat protein/serine/threonine protein kinase/class 3 adenylate cyclase
MLGSGHFQWDSAIRFDMGTRLPSGEEHVDQAGRTPRTGLVTLLFTDMVGSTALKQQLGDKAGSAFFGRHHQLVRHTLQAFAGSQEIETAGDSFLITFATPSHAVQFALLLQARLRILSQERGVRAQDRIGIHVGEVVIKGEEASAGPKDLYGIQIDTCSRVMSLAKAGQILMTRSVFDSARQVLKGEDIQEVGRLEWLHHGPYLLKGLDEPVEICEVRERGQEVLGPPGTSDKAQRQVSAGDEPVLGWRPAIGQVVPNTKWVLAEKLGEGGFGEVWLGRHETLKQQRVFKFCFRADRVRSLKREVTLFRVLKERVGEHPNIVGVQDVYFDEPPYYIVMDYAAGKDLFRWCQERGGAEKVPLTTRLEIIAQVADGLQAAHDAGVIHRDIKPSNILISSAPLSYTLSHTLSPGPNEKSETSNRQSVGQSVGQRATIAPISVKLTDFGIGQVVSEEALAGVTRLGFTQTILSSGTSSHTGTHMYMAPELDAGKPVSIRSDIYSLGVVLFQLLVGDLSRPLTTDWADHIADPLLREDLRLCFAGNPQDRFAGAGQMAKHLRSLPDRQAALARRQAELAARERLAYRRGIIRTAGVAVLIVGIMSALAVVAFRQSRLAKEEATRAAANAAELRRNLYVADMRVAQRAVQESNLGLASDLVRKYIPKPNEEDLRGWEWRYLWKLYHGDEIFSNAGDTSIVTSASFSPDGKFLATAGFDKRVTILEVATRKPLAVLEPFDDVLWRNALVFSPNGQLLAVTDGSKVKFWETTHWQKLSRTIGCEFYPLYASSTRPVAWTPAGDTLAAKTAEGIQLWDTVTWQPKGLITDPLPDLRGLFTFSPDGVFLVLSTLNRIVLWDLKTRSELANLHFEFFNPGCWSLSKKGDILAVGNYDGDVGLYDVAARRLLKKWRAHKNIAFGIALSPDGKILATGGGDQLIYLWDVATQQRLSTLQGHQNEIWALAFSPDGRTLASGSKDGTVKLWDATPKAEAPPLAGSDSPFWFSADGKVLLTADGDNRLRFWDLEIGRLTRSVDLGPEPITSAAITTDGRMTALARRSGSTEIWNVESGQCTATNRLDDLPITNLAFSHDGRFLASGATTSWTGKRPGSVRIVELATGRQLMTRHDAFGPILFSPDGKLFAASGPDHTAQLSDLAAPDQFVSLKGHHWDVYSMAFSADSKLLATGGIDNTARIWDTQTKRELAILKGHYSGVHSMAFSPDGTRIATASTDQTVRLWNVQTGQHLLTLTDYAQDIGQVIFSPDGNIVAAGTDLLHRGTLGSSSHDRPVQLWRTPSLAQIAGAP